CGAQARQLRALCHNPEAHSARRIVLLERGSAGTLCGCRCCTCGIRAFRPRSLMVAEASGRRRYLFVSNGHGEDSIAAAIIAGMPKGAEIDAYPMIGSGN